MPDEKIEVNYVRWRLGNSYKCKELLASFFNRFVVNLCFLLNSGQSAPGPNAVICPLLGGPKSMLFWTRKEKTNAIQETHAGGDYRQAA